MRFSKKMVMDKLKRGWTRKDFLAALEIDDRGFETLLLKNFYPSYLKDIKMQFEKNEKMRKKCSSSKNDKTLSMVVKDDKEASNEDIIRSLEQSKKDLESNIILMEADSKSLSQEKRRYLIELESEQKEIKNIEKQMIKHRENINALVKNLEEVNDKVSDISANMHKSKEKILQIEQQINSLRCVNIFVYENGEIEFDDDTISMSDEKCDMFDTLVSDALAEEMTIRQIRQMSKLICTIRELSLKKKRYEVTFESSVAEEMFQKYQA